MWRCNGPCRNKPPYYGYVKRSMNRAPGPHDRWYSMHQSTCGGTYIKIDGPEFHPDQFPQKKKSSKKETKEKKPKSQSKTPSTKRDKKSSDNQPTLIDLFKKVKKN